MALRDNERLSVPICDAKMMVAPAGLEPAILWREADPRSAAFTSFATGPSWGVRGFARRLGKERTLLPGRPDPRAIPASQVGYSRRAGRLSGGGMGYLVNLMLIIKAYTDSGRVNSGAAVPDM